MRIGLRGRFLIFLILLSSSSAAAEQNPFTVTHVPGVSFGKLEFKLLIGKESAHRGIVPALDDVLIDMGKDGSLQAIYDRYQ